MILIAGTVLLLGGVISFFSFRFKGIETPNYKVIKTFGDVEIREYPQMILAQTKLGVRGTILVETLDLELWPIIFLGETNSNRRLP